MKLKKIQIVYGSKKSQSSEIESDKMSIVAEKPSDVCNDSDPNELETDKVEKLNAVCVILKQMKYQLCRYIWERYTEK